MAFAVDLVVSCIAAVTVVSHFREQGQFRVVAAGAALIAAVIVRHLADVLHMQEVHVAAGGLPDLALVVRDNRYSFRHSAQNLN